MISANTAISRSGIRINATIIMALMSLLFSVPALHVRASVRYRPSRGQLRAFTANRILLFADKTPVTLQPADMVIREQSRVFGPRTNAPEYDRNIPAIVSGIAALIGLIAIAASGFYSISVLLPVAAGFGLVATIVGAIGLGRKTRNRWMAVAGMVTGMVLLTAGLIGWGLDNVSF